MARKSRDDGRSGDTPAHGKSVARRRRQADLLRENLLKRKEQIRGRVDDTDTPDGEGEDGAQR